MDILEYLKHIESIIIVVTAIIAPILALIEKSQKINLHPLTWLSNLLTGDKCFRAEIRCKIQGIEKSIDRVTDKVDNIQKEQQIKEINDIRQEILAFSRLLRNGYVPTESEFEHIFEIYDIYDKKGYNSYIHTEIEYIREMKLKYDQKDLKLKE